MSKSNPEVTSCLTTFRIISCYYWGYNKLHIYSFENKYYGQKKNAKGKVIAFETAAFANIAEKDPILFCV